MTANPIETKQSQQQKHPVKCQKYASTMTRSLIIVAIQKKRSFVTPNKPFSHDKNIKIYFETTNLLTPNFYIYFCLASFKNSSVKVTTIQSAALKYDKHVKWGQISFTSHCKLIA